jgi:hypothetical protein
MTTIAQLEDSYDRLAEALDSAGAERSELMLTKLALLAASELGAERFAALLAVALQDL